VVQNLLKVVDDLIPTATWVEILETQIEEFFPGVPGQFFGAFVGINHDPITGVEDENGLETLFEAGAMEPVGRRGSVGNIADLFAIAFSARKVLDLWVCHYSKLRRFTRSRRLGILSG
jgi:hypothetical protein